ncbi:MAG: DUF484 family protein [Pseudomonadota bacterium]
MRQLPPLTALPAFEAVARLGSVSRAAEELGRTHGAVSKQIAKLSDALGVELFVPEGTGIRLTKSGERLLPLVAEALDGLEQAMREARNHRSPSLVLGVSSTFASRWLMPRMPRFHAAHPDIAVDFKMTGLTLLDDQMTDIGLSWDRLRFDVSMISSSVALGDVSFGPVHAPNVCCEDREGVLQFETRLEQETAPGAWDSWARLTGRRVSFKASRIYPNYGLMIQAAASGLGVACAERRLVEDELDDARLMAPLGFHCVEGGFVAFVDKRARTLPEVQPFLALASEDPQRFHPDQGTDLLNFFALAFEKMIRRWLA